MKTHLHTALEQAEKARYHAPPNPWVGCVIVRGGSVVGTGHTQTPGSAHAEAVALQQAGPLARGATAYITLEPCAHHGKTPPCCDALIKAGIAAAHVGIQDPDPRVAGKGITRLREAGIAVSLETDSNLVSEQLAPYLHHRKTGRPYVVLKTACSLDGRTAAKDGTSQWITCEDARRDVHRLRDQSQAIAVGAGTAIADRPALTVRHVPRQSPNAALRVVLDRSGKVPADGPLFDPTLGPTQVHSGSLPQLLDDLGSRGILQLLVEGGPTLHSSFLQMGLVDELVTYVGPRLLGHQGYPLFQLPVDSLTNAPCLQLIETTALGQSVRLKYKMNKRLTICEQSAQ